MTTITEFLTARLDEDEATAKAATPGPWKTDDPLMSDFVGSQPRKHYVAGCSVGTGYRSGSIQDAAHIARHDPARVLAELAAKRYLLEWCLDVTGRFDWSKLNQPGSLLHDPNARATNTATMAMCAMAAPYADHPDYDQAWTCS